MASFKKKANDMVLRTNECWCCVNCLVLSCIETAKADMRCSSTARGLSGSTDVVVAVHFWRAYATAEKRNFTEV